MPDQGSNTDDREDQSTEQQQGSNGLDAKYKPGDLQSAEVIIQSLLKRLDERDAQLGQLKQRIDGIEQASRKNLEEQGNYKSLFDQTNAELEALKPYKDRAAALEEVIRIGNDTLIERIPQDKRGLVPTDYSPERLRTWLDANLSHLVNPPAPNFDGGAGSNGGRSGEKKVDVTEADRLAAEAAQNSGFKVTAEQVAARRKKES